MALAALLLLLPASAAWAQRLLTLVSGVEQAASVGDPGSMGPAPVAVEVDLDLLRSAPWRLETPTPDGSVLVAERSVFEDRGGGDLMWSGGQPGAGYDTVVLTVEGGRLVGRFGAAGGGAYQIHAERDGLGGMAPIFGPSLDAWCGVDSMAEEAHAGHSHGAVWASAGAAAADLPEWVSDPQSQDRLDILVAYTATAAENWADRGGALAAIRHAGDYLKMVFRNNRIGVEPRIVHIAQASAALDRAGRDQPWNDRSDVVGIRRPLGRELRSDGDLLYLRHLHRADLGHLFTGEPPALLGACGSQSQLLWNGDDPTSYGWATNDPTFCNDYAVIFVHEIGHALFAQHDPANANVNNGLPDYYYLFRPYAFGHRNYDVMPSLGTAMSYRGQVEPFFSTPRLRPWGAVVGIVDKRDNERVLRESVHIVARYSDGLRSLEGVPAPPSDLRVRYDRGAARLSWRGNAPDADGYELGHYRLLSTESRGGWHWVFHRAEGRTSGIVPLEGTAPGEEHRFIVTATRDGVRSLPSSIVRLYVPGEPTAAPSGVSVAAPFLSVFSDAEVSWTDNSDNETAFEVQILVDGDPIRRLAVEADSERASVGAWGLAEGRDDYEARVFAYNSSGYSESSETAPFRWAPPSAPPPPAGLSAFAVGPTTVRVSWIADPSASGYSVYAELRGWNFARWPWGASGPARGRIHTDFENLAPGGRYRFRVSPRYGNGGSSRNSKVYLTLGERGEGPAAPSDLAYVLEGRGVLLSWKDNSDNETGFEVQRTPSSLARRNQGWSRLFTVPANTESVSGGYVYPYLPEEFRVFAYNERGYSASSGLAVASGVPPEASFRVYAQCEEQACWALPGARVRFGDTSSNWAERRWSFGDGATSTLEDPTHAWSSPGRYTVTLTVSNRWGRDSATREVLVGPASRLGTCRADVETLCLWGSRFAVFTAWRRADMKEQRARVVNEGTEDSGLFHFSDPLNWEVLIKVLDGCEENGRVWVLGASTTDLGYRIEVVDTVTGESREYVNEPGEPAPAIIDTNAFTGACADGGAGR